MRTLMNKNTPIICQTNLNSADIRYIQRSIDYGANIVGLTVFSEQRNAPLSIQRFNSVKCAVKATKASVSVISVPSPFCQSAILEALEANIKLIICLTKHLPIHDMLKIKWLLKSFNSRLLGPNSTGFIIPGTIKIGAIPHELYLPGNIGIISRSNTLMHEISSQLSSASIGQSSCVSIGSNTIAGTDILDMLKLFEKDNATKKVLIIDKINIPIEKRIFRYIKQSATKPVIYYLAGISMLHQKTILSHYPRYDMYRNMEEKIKFLTENNVPFITSFAKMTAALSAPLLSTTEGCMI
jgi:succinyl-CoA synthetase alpha subunit